MEHAAILLGTIVIPALRSLKGVRALETEGHGISSGDSDVKL